MLKISLLAMVLLSLLVIGGCAKGGNGIVPTVSVSITTPANANPSAIYPTQTVTLTAMTTDPTNAPITWTLSGPGSILSTTPASSTAPATATYQAPPCGQSVWYFTRSNGLGGLVPSGSGGGSFRCCRS